MKFTNFAVLMIVCYLQMINAAPGVDLVGIKEETTKGTKVDAPAVDTTETEDICLATYEDKSLTPPEHVTIEKEATHVHSVVEGLAAVAVPESRLTLAHKEHESSDHHKAEQTEFTQTQIPFNTTTTVIVADTSKPPTPEDIAASQQIIAEQQQELINLQNIYQALVELIYQILSDGTLPRHDAIMIPDFIHIKDFAQQIEAHKAHLNREIEYLKKVRAGEGVSVHLAVTKVPANNDTVVLDAMMVR